MTQAYDIIPDIHADIDRLTSTLERLGSVQGSASWVHPKGRVAAFLGDFIDMDVRTGLFLGYRENSI